LRSTAPLFLIVFLTGLVSAAFLEPNETGRVIYRKWDDNNLVTYAMDLDTGGQTRLSVLENNSRDAIWLLLSYTPDWDTIIFVKYVGDYKDKNSYAAVYRLDFGGNPELIFKWERNPDMRLNAVYDEAENVFYVVKDTLFSKGEYYKYRTSVYLYDPKTRRAQMYAEFDDSVLLTGGSFEGNLYARYIDYDPVEDKSSGFFGYIGKDNREFQDLGFLLKDGESWFTSTVTSGGYEELYAPLYFSVVKNYDVTPNGGEYYLVYVKDSIKPDYYKVVIVQWAIDREIFYSPKADALVYYSLLEGDEPGPKIIVQPIDAGKPREVFALPAERAPGCKHPPVYSLVSVE